MTAVVAPVILPCSELPVGSQAEARKRRREILSSQRSQTMTPTDLELSNAHEMACAILPAIESAMAAPPTKKQKTEGGKSRKAGKKPQMKYDPDVPMTKEEATAWRREQRRKRNRESAAASRQRQRDRINVLEDEVDAWKSKYEATMAAIARLEQQKAEGTADAVLTHLPPLPDTSCSKFVSPPASPGHSSSYEETMSEPVASPVASTSLLPPSIVSPQGSSSSEVIKMEFCEPSDNLISRPAASRIIHNLIFDNFD
ncbi:unnamed protein product [Cylindrotheca closterium]|uniref:BZIP domain-containing protein n=1 Tax=Cylindrotheca closterium TaxID=2856 RepID=A0AAD2FB23_9STRA|nr:unnamed protein product [Cylindrotheca closterium]